MDRAGIYQGDIDRKANEKLQMADLTKLRMMQTIPKALDALFSRRTSSGKRLPNDSGQWWLKESDLSSFSRKSWQSRGQVSGTSTYKEEIEFIL